MATLDIVGALAASSDEKRAAIVLAELENRGTPLEFAAAIRQAERRDPAVSKLLAATTIAAQLKTQRPRLYRRTEFAEHALFFRNPWWPTRAKSLLVVFCGLQLRVMLPTVTLLQTLASRHFDIVVLADPRTLYFERGLAGYADSLPGIARRIAGDLRPHRYRRTVTFGVSTGGFPALRAGILLGAERAVSIGGIFGWGIMAPASGRADDSLPAFDLLCECRPESQTDIVAVFNRGNVRDRTHVARLATILPVRQIAMEGTAKHNVLWPLYKAGRLRSFLREVVGF
jgi:hypothetical protein